MRTPSRLFTGARVDAPVPPGFAGLPGAERRPDGLALLRLRPASPFSAPPVPLFLNGYGFSAASPRLPPGRGLRRLRNQTFPR